LNGVSNESISRFLAIADTRIAFDEAGAGDALVLLHAGLGDRSMFDAQMTDFARRYRVIRIDARGAGESMRTDSSYSDAGDVVAVLDHLGIDRAHVLGVSKGSQTAIEVALVAPKRVRSLIAVSARTGVPISATLRANWDEVGQIYETEGIEAANEYEIRMWIDGPLRTANEVDPVMRTAAAKMNLALLTRTDEFESEQQIEPPAAERLEEIRCPTMIIWGDHDIEDVLTAGPLLAQRIPNAQTAVVAGTSHLPQMEQPARFNRTVLDFLAGVERGSGREL